HQPHVKRSNRSLCEARGKLSQQPSQTIAICNHLENRPVSEYNDVLRRDEQLEFPLTSLIQMFARSKALFVSSIVSAILMLACVVEGQQPPPAPPAKPISGSSDEIINDSSAEQRPESSLKASPEMDLWRRETMTGDWAGTRTRWKEHGVEMQFSLAG